MLGEWARPHPGPRVPLLVPSLQCESGCGAGLGLLAGAAPLKLPVSPPPQTEVPGTATSATLGPLSFSTTYTVRVTCLYPGGSSTTLTGRLTTREWQWGWGPQATSLCSPG